MKLKIEEIGAQDLSEYARVPSRFWVRRMLTCEPVRGGLGGMVFQEKAVEPAYVKDYDTDGERPTDWAVKFDVSRWGFFLARLGSEVVGAAAVAFATQEVWMLEGRPDLAVLWDLRVRPEGRGAGVMLFKQAADWARERGCYQLKIETQNVNVPACRFYQRMGAELGEIRRYGYASCPEVADEVMLCWYLDLTR